MAALVAVLEADTDRVDYGGNLTLNASRSYDPDGVKVCQGQVHCEFLG